MAVQTIYALGASEIAISNGASLSNSGQGNGSQLMGETITLDSASWEAIEIDETQIGDTLFQDSDSSQRLNGDQEFDDVDYDDNIRVEAEYIITVEDPDGVEYTLIGFNLNEPGVTSFTTVEGLAFIGGEGEFPPIDVALTVTGTTEGPNGSSRATSYDDYATPACFVAGSFIDTPTGPRAIETLSVGDVVLTQDRGQQEIRWIGNTVLSEAQLALRPHFRPIRIRANALGSGIPTQDLMVSPQHRILISDWRADMYFGEESVLVAAKSLLNDHSICVEPPQGGTRYFHVMFDNHEILTSSGLASESFHAGAETCGSLAPETQREIRELFPCLDENWHGIACARRSLKSHEGRILAQ